MIAYVKYRHRGTVREAKLNVIQTASAVRQLFHRKPSLRTGGFTLLHVRGTHKPEAHTQETLQ